MLRYKPYIIFSLLILVGLLAFSVIRSGYYPILSVNGRWVSARTFWKNYQADSIYYQNFLNIYNLKPDPSRKDETVIPAQFKRLVLNQIVENILIGEEVKKQLGADLEALVSSRVNKIDQDAEFKKAAEAVYGLSFNEFRREILIPLAKAEILTGWLFLQGKKLDDWLSGAKQSSQVKVFSGQFFWDGSEVQFNKK